jgi:hypothetical protein
LEEIKGVMMLVTIRLGYEAETAEEGAEMEKHDEEYSGRAPTFLLAVKGSGARRR